MQTGDIVRSASPACRGPDGFDPSVALGVLGEAMIRGAQPEAASAWEAAWIACLTNSQRWAETARQEFVEAMPSPVAA